MCYNMDESSKQYAKYKKADKKDYILYESPFI